MTSSTARTTACLLSSFLWAAAPALADRVALPSDGAQSESYPLSLTALKDWKAITGKPQGAFGKSGGWQAHTAMALPPGTVIETLIAVPPLPPHESPWADRFGVLALDLSGAQGSGTAACKVEVFDEAGALLGMAQVSSNQPAAGGAGWSCDSEDETEPFRHVLDGSTESLWHTNWHQPTPLPHHLQWTAGESATITGFVYTPRFNWRTGMVKNWVLQASDDGALWHTVTTGAFDYPKHALQAKTIRLEKPATGRAFRFVALTEANGDKNAASAAEFRFLGESGVPLNPLPPAAHIPAHNARAWVYLAPEVIMPMTPPCLDKPRESAPPPKAPPNAKKLRLRVTSCGEANAVVAGIAFTRPPVKATRAMEVKPNSYGPYGPDYMALGMLGLQGQIDHGEIGVPLLAPFPDSPAAKVGIQNGDYLIAVNGMPLNPNYGHQEMGWLEDGHQPTLGRAVADALRDSAKEPRTVRVTVMRAGKPVELALHLPDAAPLWNPGKAALQGRSNSPDVMLWQGPALNDPIWAAMEKDLTAKTEAMCRPDGSFATDGANFIQIPLIGLALLQTKDPRQAERIVRCADWCLKQPDGMQRFWTVGYAGIFLTEYYLATGDARVRPWIEDALAWLPLSTHTGTLGGHAQAPGHEPNGLPYDNKGLIAPALHALLFEAVAEHAGFKAPAHDFHAQIWNYIDYSYADPARGGDGTVDYSPKGKKSDPTAGFAECWTRTGLFNEAETLRGPWPKGAVAGATLDAHSHIIYGTHAYGMPGAAWGLATMAGYAPKDYEAVVRRHGWDWLAAWQPGYGLRVTTAHMGQPYMGFEGLNNPAWLMALGARRHVLHICGGTERNWLDVSKVPMRAGEIRAVVDVNGNTELECWPTGAMVGYTNNGKAPVKTMYFGGSATLDEGGAVLAQAFDPKVRATCGTFYMGGRGVLFKPMETPALPPNGTTYPATAQTDSIGAPKWLLLPESKRNWKVLEATGWADTAECLARAALALDGKGGTAWLTNNGDHPQPFPHRLVVDTGRAHLLSGLRFDRVNFGKFVVSTSADGKTWTPIEEVNWRKAGQADGGRALVESFKNGPVSARYLKLDIQSTATDNDKPGDAGVYLGELDVIEPKPEAQVQNSAATFRVPGGFKAVVTTDGSQPTAQSPPLADGQKIPCPKGTVLRARCMKSDWVGPEMLVEGK